MHFFYELPSGQPRNNAKTLFSTLHPLSLVMSAITTVVAFVLLRNSRFIFHCYTQREPTPVRNRPGSGSYDLSRLLARKIMKGIHSCKPASLNCPIARKACASRGEEGRDGHLAVVQPGTYTWRSMGSATQTQRSLEWMWRCGTRH